MSQHRLTHVQIVNWGTFDGEWGFSVPWKGMLLTGPSGAGKSSILDAMAAVLVPPGRLRFNAAAQGTDTGDRERNLVTYVRGAHKRETDEETGEVGTAFLRKGPTWSAVALRYEDSAGAPTTLIRLFHLRGSSTDPGDLKSMYIIAPEVVDVLALTAHVENGLENRRISAAFPSWHCYGKDSYTAFSTRFRSQLGMGSQQAQILLHKTQSAKNLTNLDHLFRDFMLDVPGTYELADGTVEQFEELRVAHASVVDARRQVESLTPLRGLGQELRELVAERSALADEEGHLDDWLLARRLAAARTDLAREEPLLERLSLELEAAEREQEDAVDELRRAERAVEQSGGARIGALQESLELLGASRTEKARRADDVARAAGVVGIDPPRERADLLRFAADVDRHDGRLGAARAELRGGQRGLMESRSELSRDRREVDGGLAALRRHRSNLDPRLLAVRARLAELLAVDETRLPFVGELLQVRPEEAEWTGAIERVLGSQARSLVVPDEHYLAAAEFIDGEFLGARLVYERVGADEHGTASGEPGPGSLAGKVDIADGPYAGWLGDRLRRRFDYACVESASDFGRYQRAVTRRGQVKHSSALHEKDDRRRVDDRARWVLGFSTEQKEAELMARLAGLDSRLEEIEQQFADLDAAEERLRGDEQALAGLRGLAWDQLDTLSVDERIAGIERELEQLRHDNRDLAQREAVRDRAAAVAREAEGRRRRLAATRDAQAGKVEGLRADIGRWAERLAAGVLVPDEVAAALGARLERLDVTEERAEIAMRDAFRAAAEGIERRRSRAAGQATRVMASYGRDWPGPSADWGETVEYLPEYLDRLDDLEKDRLPDFEDRFFDLLQSQARNNISQLATMIRGDRREIRARVDEVNKSLKLTAFAADGYLQIEVRDRSLPDVDRFLATLSEITTGSLMDAAAGGSPEDRAAVEARFVLMQALLGRLASADAADRVWRDRCLDTRQHVQFQARVVDRDGTQLDVFTGSGGRSGGERQKLVTFCLAAALRFQLAPPGRLEPTYALVVIDEAFDKADHTFTQAGLEVFRSFGFQLLLATPMKMLQTIDDYVGGVVMVTNAPGRGSGLQELHYDLRRPSERRPDEGQDVLL